MLTKSAKVNSRKHQRIIGTGNTISVATQERFTDHTETEPFKLKVGISKGFISVNKSPLIAPSPDILS